MSNRKSSDSKYCEISRPLALVIFIARPTFKECLNQVLQTIKKDGRNFQASERKKEPWKEQNYG